MWGQDIIEFGAKGTTERFVAGPLPEAGQWVKLGSAGCEDGTAAGMKSAAMPSPSMAARCTLTSWASAGGWIPPPIPRYPSPPGGRRAAGKDTAGAPGDVNGWLKEGPDKPNARQELQQLRDYYLQNVCADTAAALRGGNRRSAEARRSAKPTMASHSSTFVFKDLAQPRTVL